MKAFKIMMAVAVIAAMPMLFTSCDDDPDYCKRLGITVFQPRLKVCTFARTNYYEYGKQRQVQESP